MKYIRSKYNIIVHEFSDGNLLIFNTRTCLFGKMNVQTRDIYKQIETIDIDSLEGESKKNTDTMLCGGYIVDKDLDELSLVLLQREIARHDMSSLGFTIAPTMDCNMCCPYCYEKKQASYMNEQTQEAVINFIKAHLDAYKNAKRLHISWYGGEPLLHKNAIYNLSKKIIAMCEDRKMSYNASIVTNGVLLDVETAKELAENCKVSRAQVTVDGLGDYHNKKRILKSGEDSYSIIINNLEAAKEYLQISVRVNVDKQNAGQLEPLAKVFFDEHGWYENPRIYFAPIENYENSCITDETCLNLPEFAKINVNMTKVLYAFNSDATRKELYPQRNLVHCAAEGSHGYVIDPDGDLYKCWLDVGNKSLKCGSIDKPFLVTAEYARWVLSELPQKCKECEYLPICCGGCAAHRVRNGGEPHCSHTLYSYKEKLMLAYEDYVAQKEK